MDDLFFNLLIFYLISFFSGYVFCYFLKGYMSKKRTMNEYRQTKDSYYEHPHEPVLNSIKYLCVIYPNDADLGAVIRKHFQHGKRK